MLQHVLLFLASYILVFGLFFLLYYLIPYRRVGVRVVTVSASWATLLWEVVKQLFGYYITHFATLGQIYGTYLLIVVVAFWIYYSSLVFIVGAEIGELYRERLPVND
ncbi:YihY/virulence factor BrkB family protein [bacterium]|nr:YihY/virulence factor BrkB family protein [bacterium]